MHFGLFISVLLHASLIGWAVFTIRSDRDLPLPEPEPVAVDLVTPGEVTKLRKGVRTAKQLEAQPKESPQTDVAKKEAPKPAPTASAPPPPPKEETAPEPPKEVAKADPPKAVEPPPPKEEPKAEPKPPEKVAALPPPAPATPPPVPAAEEQDKLDAKIEEELRRAEEEKKLEEQRKVEEQKKLEEERKAEEERRKAEEEQKRLEEQRKAEEQKKLEEQRQAELKKKQEEEKKRKEAELKKKREEERKRREAEAKKRFDAEKISALLNKIPDKGAPPPSQQPTQPTTNKGPVLGAPEGRDQTLSASELAVLGQIIRSCVQSKWNLLGGGEGAQRTVVKLRLRFHPDGRLAAAPQIMNPQGTVFFQAAADSAVRAAQACEPYPLPPAKYDLWRDIVLNFDPRDMF